MPTSMQSFYLQYRSSTIHYQTGGKGPRLLICLHGYGESVSSFEFLEKPLQELFTLIAIDMPLHGKTQWNEGLNFDPAELIEVLHMICTSQSLDPAKLELLGYSMGGRIGLSLFQLIPDKIEHMLLIAPDGLAASGWYKLST